MNTKQMVIIAVVALAAWYVGKNWTKWFPG